MRQVDELFRFNNRNNFYGSMQQFNCSFYSCEFVLGRFFTEKRIWKIVVKNLSYFFFKFKVFYTIILSNYLCISIKRALSVFFYTTHFIKNHFIDRNLTQNLVCDISWIKFKVSQPLTNLQFRNCFAIIDSIKLNTSNYQMFQLQLIGHYYRKQFHLKAFIKNFDSLLLLVLFFLLIGFSRESYLGKQVTIHLFLKKV